MLARCVGVTAHRVDAIIQEQQYVHILIIYNYTEGAPTVSNFGEFACGDRSRIVPGETDERKVHYCW